MERNKTQRTKRKHIANNNHDNLGFWLLLDLGLLEAADGVKHDYCCCWCIEEEKEEEKWRVGRQRSFACRLLCWNGIGWVGVVSSRRLIGLLNLFSSSFSSGCRPPFSTSSWLAGNKACRPQIARFLSFHPTNSVLYNTNTHPSIKTMCSNCRQYFHFMHWNIWNLRVFLFCCLKASFGQKYFWLD